MNAYIFQADLFCEECGERIKKELDKQGKTPRNRHYDSDEYPKGPYGEGGGESDGPQHCGSQDDCINAIELADGTKVGCWLENPITQYGVKYIKELIREDNKSSSEVLGMWKEWYSEELSND